MPSCGSRARSAAMSFGSHGVEHVEGGRPIEEVRPIRDAIRAIRAGAAGYLTKECAGDELVLAIRKAIKGERYISGSLAQIMAGELDSDPDKPIHEILSDREYQVMLLIASGKPVGTIASELSLSVKTISSYRTNILLKTGMKNNAEITHYAIKNQLVD